MGSSLLPSRLRYRMWAEGLRGTAVSDEAPDKTVVNDFYTHRLDKLLGVRLVFDWERTAIVPSVITTATPARETIRERDIIVLL